MTRRDAEASAPKAGHDTGAAGPGADPAVTAAALCAAGLVHLQAGRPLDAQMCCQEALALDPAHADTLHLMGLICLQMHQHDHAAEWLARAIRQDPRPEYLTALGLVLKQAGRLDDALAIFDKAVQLKPQDAELWKQLGGALVALNRPSDALAVYQRVLELDPRHWEATQARGVLLLQLERFEEALAHLNRCDEWRPGEASTLFHRARTLRGLKQYEACLGDYRRLHALSPDDPLVCNNIGDALLWLHRYEEGLAWFDRALALRPDLVDVLINKGLALFQLRRFDEAITAYTAAKALDPDNAKTAWQLAHLHLQTGNYRLGFAEREARWRVADFSPEYPKFTQPKWLGQDDVNGKTVLVCVDEGFGDTLQFARYLPFLAARGANVILLVRETLCSLLSGVSGVSTCIPFGTKALPPFDLHCPIMSLPLAFGTTLETIPPASYLPALPAARVTAWRNRLGLHDSFRVGLAWSGNPKQGNDHNRSMPLARLAPLLGLDATFVSLQKELRPDDKAFLEAHTDIIDLTPALEDFAETAALIENLDLVITVCTSTAHLAATLGKPTWIMLPYVGDWRWLDGRDDSPWYPSVRLFRQDASRDFAAVVDRVRTALETEISVFRP